MLEENAGLATEKTSQRQTLTARGKVRAGFECVKAFGRLVMNFAFARAQLCSVFTAAKVSRSTRVVYALAFGVPSHTPRRSEFGAVHRNSDGLTRGGCFNQVET